MGNRRRNNMKDKQLESLEFDGEGGDCGLSFWGQCPDCKERIHIAESVWWDTKCKCNREWHLSISSYCYDKKEYER